MSEEKGITTLRSIALFSILVLGLFTGPLLARAEVAGRVPRIGFLGNSSPSADAIRIEAFRQGLRELGYVEGKDIVIEYRYAKGRLDRLPNLAAELVDSNVDIIVARGTRAAQDHSALPGWWSWTWSSDREARDKASPPDDLGSKPVCE